MIVRTTTDAISTGDTARFWYNGQGGVLTARGYSLICVRDGWVDEVELRELAEMFREAADALVVDSYANRPIRDPGVHVGHCCAEHGCKYGQRKCPVARREAKQAYPCEECAEGRATL